MARQSKKLVQEVTQSTFEESFAGYNSCTARLQVLEGKMNEELTAIKEKYESRINKLQEEKEGHFEVMQVYAESHPELFEKKKSAEYTHGVIGFRTGQPKLATLRGFPWAGVFTLVKEKLSSYIRTKEEVNKELLLADRERIDLSSVGLKVTQDETFYVEPNIEVVSV
jgi:phage host-nuclease inhibitor protein Gam